jgi:hypothetical protein
MTNLKRRTLPVAVAAALGMGAVAWADQPSSPYQEVLQDARQHSVLLADAKASGGGFTIGQGDTTLTILPGMQVRFVGNWGDDRKHGDSSIVTGFEVTRARLDLEGQAFSPRLKFRAAWEAGDITGAVALLDAYGTYDLGDFALKIGQFKDLITHEGLVTWDKGLAVERSGVNEALGTPTAVAGRVQGVGIVFKSEQLAVEAAFHDGAGSANTSFQDAGSLWGISARGEFKVSGKWADYADMTARKTVDQLLVIGAGMDWTQVSGGNLIDFAIDAQFEMAKLGAYAAFIGNIADPFGYGDSTFDWGAVVQAGYALTDELEVFGRLGIVVLEDEIAGEDTFWEITAGVNYYLLNGAPGNGAKVTADVVWLPNGAVGSAYHNVIGLIGEPEIAVRIQLQVKP